MRNNDHGEEYMKIKVYIMEPRLLWRTFDSAPP